MPWTAADAERHTSKARTLRLRKIWANVANSVLRSTKDEGRAVREANGAVAKAVARRGTARARR